MSPTNLHKKDRVALFSPARLEEYAGTYYTASYMPLVLSGLRCAFSRLILISMVAKAEAMPPPTFVKVRSEFFDVRGLSPVRNGLQLYRRAISTHVRELGTIFQREAGEWSAMVINEAGIASQVAFLMCRRFAIPCFIWIGGDAWRAARARLNYYTSHWGKYARLLAAYENRLAMNLMASRANGLIVAGTELAVRYKPYNAHICEYVATTIDAEQLETELPNLRLSRTGPDFNILTVGRVTPTKGLEYLVEAAGRLYAEGVPVMVRMAGPLDEPNYQTALVRRAHELGLQNRLELLGAVPHGPALEELYRKADLLAMPSLSEGTPKVIPEAFAKGLPVVASRVGSLDRIVSEGIEGFLVQPQNVEELEHALLRLARDPQLRHRMGMAALGKAASYTLDRQIGGVGAWIRTCLAQSKC
jgi:glycosyltransferase involved in cell wall biosynthesis